jgi:methylmalonyl-CoA/ethylmalonyl-CoA epimerase
MPTATQQTGGDSLAQHLGLPPADQVGFVVPDIEASMAAYRPIFGEFTTMDTRVEAASYRGGTADVELRLAFAKSGDLEIELIEVVEGQSPHAEFIAAGRSGMHHIRFRTPDIDDKIEAARSLGYECVWYKRMNEQIAFGYLEREGDPLIIELLQMP